MRSAASLAFLLLAARPVSAQNEEALRRYFERKYVVVKVDMPASHKGIDLRFDREEPFNRGELSSRIREYDVAIAEGQRVPVTYVKVKDDLVEFHLAGGGFNWSSETTTQSFTSTPKSSREGDLERQIKDETDRDRKRRLQDELDDLRNRRQRRDERERREVEAYNLEASRRDHETALRRGSRFNVRFKKNIPPDALIPDGLMSYLTPWVDFSERPAEAAAPAPRGGADDRAWLRKGLDRREVEERLGRPVRQASCRGGDQDCVTLTYSLGGDEVEMVFVEDVLVRYAVGPAAPR